jgi:hypothetical protein
LVSVTAFVSCSKSRDFSGGTPPQAQGGDDAGNEPSAGGAGVSSGAAGEAAAGAAGAPSEPPTPCDDACAADNANAECADGTCRIAACADGFFDCDGKYSNGCEAAEPALPEIPILESPPRGAYTGSLHADPVQQTLRPALSWSAVTDTACGALRYELQLDDSCAPGGITDCAFDQVTLEATTDEPHFTPDADLPVSQQVPVGTLYSWRVRACDGSSRCSDFSTPAYFHAGRVREDLNGDGYGDAGLMQSGSMQVLLGSSQFDQTVDGTLGADLYNQPVAFLGDVNGDGFGDLGATVSYTPSAGSAPLVFFGAPDLADMTSVTVTKAAGGPSAYEYAAGAGDLNGDGFADLAITWNYKMPVAQVRVFYGAESLPANPGLVIDTPLAASVGYPFGYANGVGDLNRDGYVDLMVPVGWPPATDNNMEVQVYAGGAAPQNEPSAKVPQPNNSCLMEQTEPFAAGDLNADGFGDAVVVCRGARVGVYAGARALPNTFALVLTDTTFATALGGFDLDADGVADVAVGRKAEASQLFLGRDALASFAADPTGLKQLYGAEQLAVSDHDGDGRPDFLGMPNAAGTALWAGSNGSLNPKPLSIYAPSMKTFDRLAR